VDLSEWLVARGVPFRRAHSIVAGLVRDAYERKVPLSELVQAHPSLGTEATALLEPGVPVARRTTPGGAGLATLPEQIEHFEKRLALDHERVTHLGGFRRKSSAKKTP